MQERALLEDEDESHLYTMTRSVMAKIALAWPYPRPTTRNTMISEPRPATTRGLPPLLLIDPAETPVEPRITKLTAEVGDANFLLNTNAFNKKTETFSRYRKKRFLRTFEFKNDNVLRDTIATSKKHKEKKVFEKIKHWVPTVSMMQRYTPGIDNQWYVPKPWSRAANSTPKAHHKRSVTAPHVVSIGQFT